MPCVALGSGGSNFAVESVATLPWNERQLCYGISGNFGVESLATFAWNPWQLSRGIRRRLRVVTCMTSPLRHAPETGDWLVPIPQDRGQQLRRLAFGQPHAGGDAQLAQQRRLLLGGRVLAP